MEASGQTPEQQEAAAQAEEAKAQADLAAAHEAEAQAAQGAPAAPENTTDRSEAPGTADAPGETAEKAQDPALEGNEPPAEDQAPVATARDRVIVGDSGMYEQQPVNSVGDPDQPVRTSAPPAGLQHGVPLAEDRAAGVQPGS